MPLTNTPPDMSPLRCGNTPFAIPIPHLPRYITVENQ